jgi:hypothetical protein
MQVSRKLRALLQRLRDQVSESKRFPRRKRAWRLDEGTFLSYAHASPEPLFGLFPSG